MKVDVVLVARFWWFGIWFLMLTESDSPVRTQYEGLRTTVERYDALDTS